MKLAHLQSVQRSENAVNMMLLNVRALEANWFCQNLAKAEVMRSEFSRFRESVESSSTQPCTLFSKKKFIFHEIFQFPYFILIFQWFSFLRNKAPNKKLFVYHSIRILQNVATLTVSCYDRLLVDQWFF